MTQYTIKRTGNIFVDLGIIRLFELLGDTHCSLTTNYIKITNLDKSKLISAFIAKVDDAKNELKSKKGKKRSSVVGKFITNNTLFSQNSVTDKEFKDNYEWLVGKFFDTLENNIQGETCSFCFTYFAEPMEIIKKRGESRKREITNTRYPLLGAMGGGSGFSGFFPNTRSNLYMCYVCELLTLLNVCKIKKNVVYVPDLVTLKRLDDIVSFREQTDSMVLTDIARFGFTGIKYLSIGYGQKSEIQNFALLTPENLLKYLKVKDIVYWFKYNTEKPNELKRQIDIYLLNGNYNLVRKILLGNIVGNRADEDLRNNLKIYVNFLKEVMIMSAKEVEKEFEKSAWELKQKIDQEKIPGICYKILGYLRSDDREELLKFILHLCITNTVSLPDKISDVLLRYDENTMNYAAGKFVETLYKGIGGENE